MDFFNSAVGVLQTLVIALGAGLGIWGGYQPHGGLRQRQSGRKVTPCVTVIGKMLDVRHTAFAGKIFEKSLLIQYRVRFALLLIILGEPFIEGCNSIKIPDFRHFLTSFPSFIRSHIQWTACNIYPKTPFPLGSKGTNANFLLMYDI